MRRPVDRVESRRRTIALQVLVVAASVLHGSEPGQYVLAPPMVRVDVTSVATLALARSLTHDEPSVTSKMAIVTLVPDNVTLTESVSLPCHPRTSPFLGEGLFADMARDLHFLLSSSPGTVCRCRRTYLMIGSAAWRCFGRRRSGVGLRVPLHRFLARPHGVAP